MATTGSQIDKRWTISAPVRWALAIAAAVAAALTLWTGHRVSATRGPLITATAPQAMMSLELARSTTEAAKIVDEWNVRRPIIWDGTLRESPFEVVPINLARDDRFIPAYSAAFLLAALLALAAVAAPRWLAASVAGAAVAAGLCDWAENRILEDFLHLATRPWWLGWVGAHEVTWARTFAQTKFGLLLVVGLVTLTAALAALRTWWHQLNEDPSERRTFQELAETEAKDIVEESRRTGGSDELRVTSGSTDEPWVSFRSRDLVGLALSGGGIRSATFNLGLLNGLHKLRVLPRVDYLATVSGGGYVGSFWTAWLRNQPGVPVGERRLWPNGDGVEVGPIRHLREFSRFLAARIGFFEPEMWEAVVTVLAGLIPAFLAAASVIGLVLIVWLGTNFFLACPEPWAGVFAVFLLTTGVLVWFERAWAAGDRLDDADVATSRRVNTLTAVFAVALALLVEWGYVHHLPRQTKWMLDGRSGWTQLTETSYETWWHLTGIAVSQNQPCWPVTGSAGSEEWACQPRTAIYQPTKDQPWFWSPRLYDLAYVWFLVGLLLLALRAPFAVAARRRSRDGTETHDRVWVPAFDRVVMRLLGSALAWASLATLWHVSVNFLPLARRMTVASLVSAGAFAALRNWIGVTLRSGTQASALDRLKPYLPQLLAYLTVALLVAGVGSVLIVVGNTDWFRWYGVTGGMGFAIAMMMLFDPGEIGLHSFYRDRLVRAYAGASNRASDGFAAANRQTDRRKADDLCLADLPKWPLHLVCCAANDLSGDPIETLGRGARSATLSHHGIAMADGWAPPGKWLTLGGAVTASAAAFNSNMGAVSMSVGPVVAFLMAALNLRLGLWVPNPRRPPRARMRLLPGALFFREMFSLTTADSDAPEIHLSDGAHFENLALYELVRRHCRYIVVSDCGEDPAVAFDDFGNAARRVREDFGVHIDVDLSALKPADRRSRQHVVVGTIHYSDFDKGILLYVKPTLTGDEPPDVLQYSTRNESFPHESTVDQFYDEAQWESYRKLGEHTACTVFGFVDRYPGNGEGPPADWIFTTARQDWYPTPPDLPASVLKMTARFGSVESELQREGAAAMLHEVFPELRRIWKAGEAEQKPTDTAHAANLACLLRVTQLMEDVWTECQLDTFWNHPLNLGWVNCFARWASAPTFRMWWPLIRPMYGAEFQRFMQERFAILDQEGVQDGAVSGPTVSIPDGLSARWWRERHTPAPAMLDRQGGHKRAYEYLLRLPTPGSPNPTPMQVGLLLLRHLPDDAGAWAWWTSDDFFVPPSLWGAGIGGAFLWKFLKHARERKMASRLDVYVKAPEGRNDPGSWADRVSYVEFYKKQGFRICHEVRELPDGEPCRAIKLELTF